MFVPPAFSFCHYNVGSAPLNELRHRIADCRELCCLQLANLSRDEAAMGSEKFSGAQIAGPAQ